MQDLIIPLAMLFVGILSGASVSWWIARIKREQAIDQARGEKAAEMATLAAKEDIQAQNIEELKTQLASRDSEIENQRQRIGELQSRTAELTTLLQEARRQSEEKLALLNDAQAKLKEAFGSLASDALNRNNEAFLKLAGTRFETLSKTSSGDLERRRQAIDELVKPMRESLGKLTDRLSDIEKSRLEAYSTLKTEVKSLGETQRELRSETANLVRALRKPEVRGRWGEIQLRRVAELAGMMEHCDFDEQVAMESNGQAQRPDMVVRLPGSKSIVVDSKVPLEAYLAAIESENDAETSVQLDRHATQLKRHIEQLSKKRYFEQFENTPEFVVLFVPIEACLSAALAREPRMLEHGAEAGVIVATPTTLISLLRAVYHGWRQETLAENAREISNLGRELYDRLKKCGEHFGKVGKSLDSATQHYNRAVGSLESRVLPTARKFQELGVVSREDEIPELVGIEHSARLPTAPELIEQKS